MRDMVNKIWDITSRPDQHLFTKKWICFILFFSLVFGVFIITTTLFMQRKKYEFRGFNDFLNDFSDNQVSITQAITYLREVNINLYTKVSDKIPLVPAIVLQVEKLSVKMHEYLLKLGTYLTDTWMCLDVLDYGSRIARN